ncbi:MAG TPA: hypothetical protein VNH11_10160 [Pirellulales bacterium]|nr:hypothetical protein [Pirellulales bacterium]
MTTVAQKILLRSDRQFHGKLPPRHIGLLLAELPLAVRQATSMALRSCSTARGPCPAWLERAADVRFVGHESNGETSLWFEAPRLGDAAPEIYSQKSLFPESRPLADDTGFDLLADVLADVERRNADSPNYDPPLLRRIANSRRLFKRGPFREFDVLSRRFGPDAPARLSPEVAESARCLLGRTPAPQRVRLVGQLDGLVASTQQFSLLLDTGEKVVGVFPDDQADCMRHLWRARVLVLGTAVYRASEKLLRVDAEAVKPGENESTIFSRMPTPSHAKLDISKLHKAQGPRSGMAAIMGQWPGDETDEEVAAALERLS